MIRPDISPDRIGFMEQLNLSEAEWRRRLSPEQYKVLREAGPERPVANPFFDHRADGLYHCAACRLDLFDSHDRTDNDGAGPGFHAPIALDRVTDHPAAGGTGRIETRCARCDSHLGHRTDDAPPAGRLYRLAAIALGFRARR